MQLPEFLHIADGEIRIVGHRIGLHHVVKAYNEGYSAEMNCGDIPHASAVDGLPRPRVLPGQREGDR